MTYCLGWKYRDSIFLIADTAVTKEERLLVSHSSFGELHQNIEGGNVEESLLKIVPIDENAVLTFSGDVELAKKVIQFIKSAYEYTKDMGQVLSAINASLGPFKKDKNVAIIIGNHVGGRPLLYRWEAAFPDKIVEGEDIIWTGSLPLSYGQIAPLLLKEFMTGGMPTERMLPIISSMLQSLGIHNNILKFGVGGVFVGIQLNEEGYHWQKDTMYILADNDFSKENLDFVKTFIRDNALIVRSSIGNITRVFLDYMNDQSIEDWISKWSDLVNVELKRGNASFFCLMNKKFHNVIIIKSKNCSSDTEYSKVKLLDEGNTINLKVREDLYEMFKTPIAYEKGDGSLPLSFRFLDYEDHYE